MQCVFDNWFIEMKIEPSKSLMCDTWKKTSKNLTESEFREILDEWAKLIQKHEIRYGLTDSSEMRYDLPIDMQIYAAEKLKEAVAHGYEKHAMVLPENDLLVEVRVETSIDVANEQVETEQEIASCFKSKEEALAWLGVR